MYRTNTLKAECISCDQLIDIGGKPKLGQLVRCPKCDAQLEIVWLNPPELDWILDEEDFDDDWYDE